MFDSGTETQYGYCHSMTVKIKRFDTSLPLPAHQSEKAAAFDLYAREDVIIQPRQVALVPLNIALQVPKDHWVLLAARSSLHKKGLMMANGIGVGDEDYCGDEDEYKAALLNYTDEPVAIKKGDRIVQALILPREPVTLTEVTSLNKTSRGGFGSTGSR